MPKRPLTISRSLRAPTAAPPDRRVRGNAGVRLREQVRREEPLCRECLKVGKFSATQEIDHIVPLALGGAESRANRQGLCVPCHRAKTAREAAEAARRGGGVGPRG